MLKHTYRLEDDGTRRGCDYFLKHNFSNLALSHMLAYDISCEHPLAVVQRENRSIKQVYSFVLRYCGKSANLLLQLIRYNRDDILRHELRDEGNRRVEAVLNFFSNKFENIVENTCDSGSRSSSRK